MPASSHAEESSDCSVDEDAEHADADEESSADESTPPSPRSESSGEDADEDAELASLIKASLLVRPIATSLTASFNRRW